MDIKTKDGIKKITLKPHSHTYISFYEREMGKKGQPNLNMIIVIFYPLNLNLKKQGIQISVCYFIWKCLLIYKRTHMFICNYERVHYFVLKCK